jgi:hypothetical protein
MSLYLRAVVLLATEELGELAEIVTFVSVAIATLLVPPPHTSLVVLRSERERATYSSQLVHSYGGKIYRWDRSEKKRKKATQGNSNALHLSPSDLVAPLLHTHPFLLLFPIISLNFPSLTSCLPLDP